jgi:hypothetical protein
MVKKIWWRHKYQGEKSNLCHINCLLWVGGADKDEIVDRIRGSVAELICPEEINDLIGEGFYKSFNYILKIRDCARHFLFHHCGQRCLRRTGPGDDQLKCRVPATILLNPVYTEHSRVTIELHHASRCLDVLKDLGLCHDNCVWCETSIVAFC